MKAQLFVLILCACVLPSCFRSAQRCDSKSSSARKVQAPLFAMNGTGATIRVKICVSKARVRVCIYLNLALLFWGLSHNKHVLSTASERQAVTSWAASIPCAECSSTSFFYSLKTFSGRRDRERENGKMNKLKKFGSKSRRNCNACVQSICASHKE